MSLIQCVCACAWLRNVVAGGGGGLVEGEAGRMGSETSRLRSQAHMTPSRPPEYLHAIRTDHGEAAEAVQERVVCIYGEPIDPETMSASRVGKWQD